MDFFSLRSFILLPYRVTHITTAFTGFLFMHKARAPTTSPLFPAGSDGVSLLFGVVTSVVSRGCNL